MQLLESGEMYLETILILTKRKDSVRAIDVAEYMGYTKPSVSRALGILRKGGYIEVDSTGYLSLTDDGMLVASKIYERHRLITDMLVRLGVSEETAAADACRIEHHISDETFDAIKNHVIREI